MEKVTASMLEEEIRAEIQDLSALATGSDEKASAIDDLVKLYKLKIEETKNEWDVGKRYDERTAEKNQLSEQVKDRYFKLGIDAASIVLPLIFYAIWMRKGFKFEETGTYTSTTFRGLFNRFRPTKN